MARSLTFELGGKSYAGAISRIDRARLYGRVQQLATDKYGAALEKAALDEDGATIVSAAGFGYQDEDGRWLARTALGAVDEEGRPLPVLPSSFDAAIALQESESVDLDEYHLHEIESLYLLDGDLDGLVADCEDYFEARGRLYRCPFRFRAGHESSTAILLPRAGRLYLAVGRRALVEFVGRRHRYVIDELTESEEDEGEIEELDFQFA